MTRPYITYFLCAACAVVFLWQLWLGDIRNFSLGYPLYTGSVEVFSGAYWGLLWSFFLHGSIYHIAFNLYWLHRLGTALERRIGWWRYLLFWVVATAFSSALQIEVSGITGIGASGFGYALFGFVWLAGKSDPDLAEAMDASVVQLFAGWFFLCLFLTWAGVWAVANVAHMAGYIIGAMFGFAFIARPEPMWKSAAVALLVLGFLPLFHAPWLGAWNLAQGLKAYDRENYRQALDYFDHANLPEYETYVAEMRAGALASLGRNSDAVAVYRNLFARSDADLANADYAYNDCAWILATTPDDKLRSPTEAIRYAELACKLHNYSEANDIDTLAAAYAANGQFDQAIDWQQKAIAAGGHGENLDDMKERLKLYQSHQSYIDKGGNGR